MSTAFIFLSHFSIVAYALVGGVFLAFSDFIMRSLALTSGQGGVEAMQVINREVFRWVFMALFLGLAPVSLFLAGYGLFGLSGTVGTVIALAGLVYVVGCFGVTVFFNVPMNEALARMETSSSTTLDYWLQTYVPRWTFWNSVRTVACMASSGLLLVGIFLMAQMNR